MAPVTRAAEQQTVLGADRQKAKISLYWLEKSRSQRILWLLEELSLPYELITYKRENMLAPPELKKIHPLGKAPLMKIESEAMPEDKPLILAESANMVEYVVEHFGQHLAPKRWREGKEGQIGGETEEWMRYRYYLHYAEGSLMPPLVIALLFNAIETKSPFFIKPLASMMVGAVKKNFLTPTSETNFAFLESQIASSPNGGKYLCGETLTAADIMMSFPLGAAKGRSTFSKEKHPKLWEYVERLENMDAYKKAVQKIIEVEGSYDGSL